MTWLGSIQNAFQGLGSMASNAVQHLGSVQSAVKSGLQNASNVVGDIGKTISGQADNLDSIGLGGVARYAGGGLSSASTLGNAVANLVGSQNLDEAIGNGVNAYKAGLNFGGALADTGKLYSPLTKS